MNHLNKCLIFDLQKNKKITFILFFACCFFNILELVKIILYIIFFILSRKNGNEEIFKFQTVLPFNISSAVILPFIFFILCKENNKSFFFNILTIFTFIAILFLPIDIYNWQPWILKEKSNIESLQWWNWFSTWHNFCFHLLLVPFFVFIIFYFKRYFNFSDSKHFLIFCGFYIYFLYVLSQIFHSIGYNDLYFQFIAFNKQMKPFYIWTGQNTYLYNTIMLLTYGIFPLTFFSFKWISKIRIKK